MKAQDIVDTLAARIPNFTNGFTNSVTITSAGVSGTTVSVVASSAHDLTSGDNVGITGLSVQIPIDESTFLRVLTIATFETEQDHDFTLSERDIAAGGKTLTISGANEAEFNGTFQIARVVNRRTLEITVADSGPTTMTGSPVVEDGAINVVNGLFTATVTSATNFTYQVSISYIPSTLTVTNGLVQISLRIGSVLDIEQYLQEVYTKQSLNDDFLVVALGDVTQSKSRNEQTDAATSAIGSDSFIPILIQPFDVYIIQNVTDDLTGAQARDKVESEYIPAIFSSILREPFDSQFTYNGYRATFIVHRVFAYSDINGKNKAIYAHQVSFEQLVQITTVDAVGADFSVAMRNVEYTLTTSLGTGILTAGVDLDEEPIP